MRIILTLLKLKQIKYQVPVLKQPVETAIDQPVHLFIYFYLSQFHTCLTRVFLKTYLPKPNFLKSIFCSFTKVCNMQQMKVKPNVVDSACISFHILAVITALIMKAATMIKGVIMPKIWKLIQVDSATFAFTFHPR